MLRHRVLSVLTPIGEKCQAEASKDNRGVSDRDCFELRTGDSESRGFCGLYWSSFFSQPGHPNSPIPFPGCHKDGGNHLSTCSRRMRAKLKDIQTAQKSSKENLRALCSSLFFPLLMVLRCSPGTLARQASALALSPTPAL